MITKEKLFKHIENFPNEMEIEDLIERLLFINKIEERIKESDANKTISEEELDLEISKW